MNNEMPDELYVDAVFIPESIESEFFAGDATKNEPFGTKYIRADRAPAPKAAEDLSQPNALPYVPLRTAYSTQEHTTPTPPNAALDDAVIQDALDRLITLQIRAYSHAEKSNSPKEMRDWIDRDVEHIKAALRNTEIKG